MTAKFAPNQATPAPHVSPVNEFNENVRLMEQDFDAYAEKFLQKPELKDYMPQKTRLDRWIDRLFGIA